MMITCPNCGTANDDKNKFCQKCSTSLAQPVAPVAAPTLISVSNERGPVPVSLVATPVIINVKIADFNMPFFSLVGILVKVAIASIPATLVLALLGGGIFFGCSLMSAFLVGLLASMGRR